MSDLFGGSKSGSKDMTPGVFKDLQAPFANALQSLFQGSPSTLFSIPQSQAAQQGKLSAPITQAESGVLGQLQNAGWDQRQQYLNDVIGGKFLPGQAGSNPFLQAAIEAAQRPTLQGLGEQLERSLPGRFTAGGQFTTPGGSSAFDRAAAIATRGAADTMGDIAANMSNQNFEAERGRQNQAVQLGQQEVNTLVTNLQAQGLPRLIEDMGIQRGLTEFSQRLNALMQALGLFGQAASPVMGQQSETKPNIVGTLFPKGLGAVPAPSLPPV